MEEKKGRGGPRKGAGRKHKFNEPVKAITLRFPLSTYELIQNKGGAPWLRDYIINELKK